MNQRTRAIEELDQLLRGDHAVAAAVTTSTSGGGSSLLSKALKETASEKVRLYVVVARKEVKEITCAAAEKQREADTKRSGFFEAHA